MRVLHVLPSLSARIGGPAANVVGAALALRDAGIESTIVATDMAGAVSAPHRPVMPGDLPARYESLDVRLFPARTPHRLAFAPSMLSALDRLVPVYDAVHIHMLFTFPQFAAYRACMRHGVPYIVAPCGALDPHLRPRSRFAKRITDAAWQRSMLDRAAGVHFKTEGEARLVDDLGIHARRFVVPNGIDWPSIQGLPAPGEFRRTRLDGFDGPLLLSMGRISHKKGLDILIRALPLVRRDVREARLVLAGPDDENRTPQLRALAKECGVEHAITFTGMLHGDEKLAALAAADVWALPSHSENFGMAAVEAMAAGLPVVLSPGVNIAGDAQAAGACMVAHTSPEAFAAALVALLRDRSAAHSLADGAREFSRRYDWSHVAPQFAGMYRDVISEERGVRRAA